MKYEYIVDLCFYCSKIMNSNEAYYCSGCGKRIKTREARLFEQDDGE